MTNFNSVVPVTSVKYNNANGSSLVISALNDGTIMVRFYSKVTTSINTTKRWELTQAVQKVKFFLLARCHQNSDKDTERGAENFYLISKSFTKLINVSSQVSTEKAFYKWKPFSRFFRHIKSEFSESIKKRLIVFRHVRRELSDTLRNQNSLAESANFSRQIAIT